MDRSNGKDLLKTLNTLDIDLGALRPEVVEAWFDTDDADLLNFLHWITTSLSEDNVVSPHDLKQYEQLKRKELILHGHEYESALQDVKNKYPNLLDVKDNIFETECLEMEIAMYLDEENRLERVINLNKELDESLKKSLYVSTKELDHSVINMEKAEENCLQLSQRLDEKNVELHQKMIKCCDKLVDFEHGDGASYISNMPMNLYDRHHSDVVAYVSQMFKEQYKYTPQLQSIVNTCSKVNETIFEHNNVGDRILILKDRLFKSVQDKNYKEVRERRLRAELEYCENIDLRELKCMHVKSSNLKFHLEASIRSKEEQIDMLLLKLENCAREASDMYVELPKWHLAENESKMVQAKCDELSVIQQKFSTIFSYHTLIWVMFMANNSDIKACDEFFRAVHHYITHDLYESEKRTDAMTDVINNYKIHNGKPIEETNPFVKALINLMPGKVSPLTIKEAVNLFNMNQSERKNIEMQLFYDEFTNHRSVCKEIEMSCNLLKSFLQSGPTSEYITLPFELFQMFEKVKSILESQKNIVKSSMQIRNNALQRLSENKWFKLRRQLWMYFITQPKSVLSYIQQIEAEVNKK